MTRANHVWAVVLMYGNEDVTAACLESLLAQRHAPLTVLLVDNRAADGGGARLRARFPAIQYVDTGANLGYAGGMNRGIEHALAQGADDVLLLNNDTTLDPGCVEELVRVRNTEFRVGLVTPRILWYDDPGRVWYAGGHLSRLRAVGVHHRFGQQDDHGDGASPRRVTFASGCAFLVPATVARELGGFAEDFFMYCEDVEWCLRLQDAGYGLYYAPAARLYHRDRPTGQPAPHEIRYRDRNRRRIARRHYALRERLTFAAWFYPTRLMRLGQYVAAGDLARARAIIQGATER